MKKLFCLMLCGVICLSFSGCFSIKISINEPEFAREDYSNNSRIAEDDRYDDGDTYVYRSDGRYWGGYEEFLGRRTIAECPSEENKSVSAELELITKKGKAKVVFVDAELNVTTLIEYESGDTSGLAKKTTATVECLKGENFFKLVGYDCEDLTVELHFFDNMEEKS